MNHKLVPYLLFCLRFRSITDQQTRRQRNLLSLEAKAARATEELKVEEQTKHLMGRDAVVLYFLVYHVNVLFPTRINISLLHVVDLYCNTQGNLTMDQNLT